MQYDKWQSSLEISKVVEVVFEIFKGHLVLVDLGIFKTVLYLIQADSFVGCLEHCHNILRT